MLFVQFIYFLVIYIFHPILTITVEIDGRIDLEHSWEHENPTTMQERYPPLLRTLMTDKKDNKYESTNEEIDTIVNTHVNNVDFNKNDTKEEKKNNKKATNVESLNHDNLDLVILSNDKKKSKAINKIKARKVKEDANINDFVKHIFKQTLKLFDGMQTKSDHKLKHEIRSLKRAFKERFGKYLSETYNHTLKTNLGKQKIILNTIDTSHKILQRLVNNLHKDGDHEALRTNTVDTFKRAIDREIDAENKHACQKLGVYRVNDFSNFVSDVIIILMQTDDRKIKQAADALTEAVKNTDFDNVLNYDLQMKLKRHMTSMEHWDALMTRAVFLCIKRLIANRNKPIVIYNNVDNYLANKTIAFQEVISLVDEKLPKNENVKEWENMKQDIIDWKDDKNKNALEIAENFVKHLNWKALDKLDYEGKKRFNRAMAVLLSHLSD